MMSKRKAANGQAPVAANRRAINQAKKPRGSVKDLLPLSHSLMDFQGNTWAVGVKIASGGFGSIYETCLQSRKKEGLKKDQKEYVIKAEPIGSGPLFCEIHYYMVAGRGKQIQDFQTLHGLEHLGVPVLYGHGSATVSPGLDARFMIMERYGANMEEYTHMQGFTHADVKAANILFDPADERCIYLVDFGLASRFTTARSGDHDLTKNHLEYKVRPQKHDGTVEYTSIDAHTGAKASRRSDIEILLYNLLDWLSDGQLPWRTDTNPDKVAAMKAQFREGHVKLIVDMLIRFSKDFIAAITDFATNVYSLTYKQTPDYRLLRSYLERALYCLTKTKTPFDGLLSLPLDEEKTSSSSSRRSVHGRTVQANSAVVAESEVSESQHFVCKRRPNRKPRHKAIQTSPSRR